MEGWKTITIKKGTWEELNQIKNNLKIEKGRRNFDKAIKKLIDYFHGKTDETIFDPLEDELPTTREE